MSLRGFRAYQVGPPQLVDGLGVVQLDVQVLVDALERAADLDFVLELYGDFVLDERLEEATARVSGGSCLRLRLRWALAVGGGLELAGVGEPEEEHCRREV